MTPRHYLLFILLLLSASIASIHYAALSMYLYWEFWWFDIVVHFLGGLWAGLAGLWLVFYSNYTEYISRYAKHHPFLVSIVSVIFIGTLWEVFEIAVGMPRAENFVSDTVIDIIMDLIGAFVAYGVFHIFFAKSTKEDIVSEVETDVIN